MFLFRYLLHVPAKPSETTEMAIYANVQYVVQFTNGAIHSFCASEQARLCILAFFHFHVFVDHSFHCLRFKCLNFGVTFALRPRCQRTAGSAAAARLCASSAEGVFAAARVLPQCCWNRVRLFGWWFCIHNNATLFWLMFVRFLDLFVLCGVCFIFIK